MEGENERCLNGSLRSLFNVKTFVQSGSRRVNRQFDQGVKKSFDLTYTEFTLRLVDFLLLLCGEIFLFTLCHLQGVDIDKRGATARAQGLRQGEYICRSAVKKKMTYLFPFFVSFFLRTSKYNHTF